jgi:hypothetical protein
MDHGDADMLNALHDKINNIIHINSVVDKDGIISIDYIDQPTQQQINQINTLISNWPLEKAKIEKLTQVDIEWNNTLKNGWTTPSGWKLGINTQDVALLTGAFTLCKEASSLGMTDPVSIIDMDGDAHALSLPELTSLMLQYGQARAALSSDYAQSKKIIKEATTLQELEAI